MVKFHANSKNVLELFMCILRIVICEIFRIGLDNTLCIHLYIHCMHSFSLFLAKTTYYTFKRCRNVLSASV